MVDAVTRSMFGGHLHQINFKKLYVDDGLVIFAWILALVAAIIWRVVAQFMTITSSQLWPPLATFIKETDKVLQGSLASLVLYYASLHAV